MEIDRL